MTKVMLVCRCTRVVGFSDHDMRGDTFFIYKNKDGCLSLI